MRRGDSAQFLSEYGETIFLEQRVDLWSDVVAGVAYLHSLQPVLIHGDLKPKNVLVNDYGNAQICDFGLVRLDLDEEVKTNTTSHFTGTERYLSYELVDAGEYACPTAASDVHALACIGLEFIFLVLPYAHRKSNRGGVICMDIKAGILPSHGLNPPNQPTEIQLWDLLTQCWDPEPYSRPDPNQILQYIRSWRGQGSSSDLASLRSDPSWEMLDTSTPFLPSYDHTSAIYHSDAIRWNVGNDCTDIDCSSLPPRFLMRQPIVDQSLVPLEDKDPWNTNSLMDSDVPTNLEPTVSFEYNDDKRQETAPQLKRSPRSCDACRSRKVRCSKDNLDDHSSCMNCISLGVPCTYDYQPKKRGPPNLYLRRLQEAAFSGASVGKEQQAITAEALASINQVKQETNGQEDAAPMTTWVSSSCDGCRSRKVRCNKDNPDDQTRCENCISSGSSCTYEYQPRELGPPDLYVRRLQEAAPRNTIIGEKKQEATKGALDSAARIEQETNGLEEGAPMVPRVSSACDVCFSRKLECIKDKPDGWTRCVNCISFGTPCTHQRKTQDAPALHDPGPLKFSWVDDLDTINTGKEPPWIAGEPAIAAETPISLSGACMSCKRLKILCVRDNPGSWKDCSHCTLLGVFCIVATRSATGRHALRVQNPENSSSSEDDDSEQSSTLAQHRSRACDACRRLHMRCVKDDPNNSTMSCKRCVNSGRLCTYNYLPKPPLDDVPQYFDGSDHISSTSYAMVRASHALDQQMLGPYPLRYGLATNITAQDAEELPPLATVSPQQEADGNTGQHGQHHGEKRRATVLEEDDWVVLGERPVDEANTETSHPDSTKATTEPSGRSNDQVFLGYKFKRFPPSTAVKKDAYRGPRPLPTIPSYGSNQIPPSQTQHEVLHSFFQSLLTSRTAQQSSMRPSEVTPVIQGSVDNRVEQSQALEYCLFGPDEHEREHSLPSSASQEPTLPAGPRRLVQKWTRGPLLRKSQHFKTFLAYEEDMVSTFVIKYRRLAEDGGEDTSTITNERDILRRLHHPHLLTFFDCQVRSRSVGLFMDHMSAGSLEDVYLASGEPFREETIRTYTSQIADALSYIHAKGVVHRNLRGASIFIDHEGRCKIADFDFAIQEGKQKGKPIDLPKDTFFWRAPEALGSSTTPMGRDPAVDMWSLGCVVLEMLTVDRPWGTKTEDEVCEMFKAHEEPAVQLFVEAGCSPETKDLYSQCLRMSPQSRPTAQELVSSLAGATIWSVPILKT